MIFTKINIHNTEILGGEENLKVNRKQKIGTIIASSLIAVTILVGSMFGINSHKQQIEEMIPPFSTSVVLDDINEMNLIINDNNCSDTFFQSVTDILKEDGVNFTTTRDGDNINQNNATIITLDQQYSAGEGTIIFAPYDNARVGNSDSLALAMYAAFYQNGFTVSDISCGKVGYEEDEDGNVHYYLPTSTEKEINEGYDSSFVTISFGTNNLNPEWVAKSIENGLARFVDYRNNYDSQQDLIYRADNGQDAEDVANYFGTSTADLVSFNKLENTKLGAQTIINPIAGNTEPFNKITIYNIGEVKTRAY